MNQNLSLAAMNCEKGGYIKNTICIAKITPYSDEEVDHEENIES